jgi:transposase
MSKYSYEFKKEIVMAYINGEGGKIFLASKYGVKSPTNIIKWVKSYKEFGDDGLMRSRQNKKYTFEFKLSVVELYLTTEISYQELALQVDINNPPLITKWVNDYRIAGPDALREKSKGRRHIVPKPKNNDKNSESVEYIKQLENDLLKLKIENAYLKELRRLRLEQEALNKKRELSVASEENLD